MKNYGTDGDGNIGHIKCQTTMPYKFTMPYNYVYRIFSCHISVCII